MKKRATKRAPKKPAKKKEPIRHEAHGDAALCPECKSLFVLEEAYAQAPEPTLDGKPTSERRRYLSCRQCSYFWSEVVRA